MPNKAPHPCAEPGCGRLTRDARCGRHALRPNPVYQTTTWRRVRKAFLALHPVCKCGRPTVDVDHIIPIRRGGPPFDETNLQAFCHGCHARKTLQETRENTT